VDFKTELQEELARRGLSVSYAVLEVEGPPHERRFTCSANIEGEEVGVGVGDSKKAAEQAAAREALRKLVSSGQ
jgi:ribonuclease III